MPPKCKFTREEIVQTALDMVRKDGLASITARALGNKLGSSSKPIFSVFENMEEVHIEVQKLARALYAEYVQVGLDQEMAFKGVSTQYILFAIKEPKLFQLLFVAEQSQKASVSRFPPIIDESHEQILLSVQNGYDLDKENAERLYRHLWIYTHGIAVLCATNMCSFTVEEISNMISEVFKSLLITIKGENIE